MERKYATNSLNIDFGSNMTTFHCGVIEQVDA